MLSRKMEFASEREMLFVEQAQAMYREVSERAEAAPDGEVLDVIESLAIQRGREMTRKAIEGTAQDDIDRVEKKGPRRAPVHAVEVDITVENVRKRS